MKILVCGDRHWANRDRLRNVLQDLKDRGVLTALIEGEAPGADRMARDWAVDAGVPVQRFPAQWHRFGKAAGSMRNAQMLKEGKPDLVIAFHNDIVNSKGTKNMILRALQQGLPVLRFGFTGEAHHE